MTERQGVETEVGARPERRPRKSANERNTGGKGRRGKNALSNAQAGTVASVTSCLRALRLLVDERCRAARDARRTDFGAVDESLARSAELCAPQVPAALPGEAHGTSGGARGVQAIRVRRILDRLG